ncbi:hypothetical protein UlMin_030167 [Ulmus minor]
MKSKEFLSIVADAHSRRSWFCSLLPATLLFIAFFLVCSFLAPDYKERFTIEVFSDSLQNLKCKDQCKPNGSELLPEAIVSKTSNLELRPLWGSPEKNEGSSVNLIAIPVGIGQKDLVNKTVTKFLSSNFVVMLFHYDGNVDEWKSFEWNDNVIHVSAASQTKWWFAKRFLHPDIVAQYSYIFLWDEDLGVESFDPERYLSIVKSEGLEISQPALDRVKSTEVHHQITTRWRGSIVHRRMYSRSCDENSSAPPCTGWIEMMAPVFSRASWRCVWYMIQNDLVHAWGLDMQLGYCAQGDRTKNVGVVDAEYIIHYGRPTLGGDANKTDVSADDQSSKRQHSTSTEILAPSHPSGHRADVRRQSYREFNMFKKRWKNAVEEDQCWVDPFQ